MQIWALWDHLCVYEVKVKGHDEGVCVCVCVCVCVLVYVLLLKKAPPTHSSLHPHPVSRSVASLEVCVKASWSHYWQDCFWGGLQESLPEPLCSWHITAPHTVCHNLPQVFLTSALGDEVISTFLGHWTTTPSTRKTVLISQCSWFEMLILKRTIHRIWGLTIWLHQ